MDGLFETGGRDLLTAAVGVHPVGERAAAPDRFVELAVGVAVALRVTFGDVDVEVLPHLLDESDVFAGELAAGACERLQVCRQVVGPGGVQTTAGHLREQSPGLARQIGRIGSGFVGDLPAQPRVAGERIDVTLLDPVEAQSEKQIFVDQGL